MISDAEIRNSIIAELKWVPDVDDTDIDVQVTNGIVTLTGFVPDYNNRFQAEAAAKRVKGVTGVANEIKVTPACAELRADPAIARHAVDAIRGDLPGVADNIQVVVSNGHLTLEGTVEWQWQRQRLESTVRAIEGVLVVNNLIVVRPGTVPENIKRRIEEAFLRSAEVDVGNISVEAHDGDVILRGTVRSLHEKQEAHRTAWAAPGVRRVIDEIAVAR